MSTPFNQLTDAQAERLALLLEELGEAQQAIGKILRHGYESRHPSKPHGPSNRDSLEIELGDVAAAIDIMKMAKDIEDATIKNHRDYKLVSVEKYLHHQKVV